MGKEELNMIMNAKLTSPSVRRKMVDGILPSLEVKIRSRAAYIAVPPRFASIVDTACLYVKIKYRMKLSAKNNQNFTAV